MTGAPPDPAPPVTGAPPEADPAAALEELAGAAGKAAAALAGQAWDDDVTAFACVIALDTALRPLSRLLGAAPAVIQAAAPGAAVSERISAAREELARHQGAVAAARAELTVLHATLRELADATAERAALDAQVAELERSRQLTAELPVLRSRLSTLRAELSAASDDASDHAGDDASDVAAHLAAAAAELGRLTRQQRDLLGAEAAGLIAEAERIAASCAEVTSRRDAAAADLDARAGELAQLNASLLDELPALEAWRQADADLAAGIAAAGLRGAAPPDGTPPDGTPPDGTPADGPRLARVRAGLADLGRRLSDLDTQLRPLLANHARAYEAAREARPLTGRREG